MKLLNLKENIIISIECGIVSGVYKTDDEIISVSRLCKENNASSTTVVNALRTLKNAGVLVYRPGRNYIVTDKALEICENDISQLIKDKLTDIITLSVMTIRPEDDFISFFSDTEYKMLSAIIHIAAESLAAEDKKGSKKS